MVTCPVLVSGDAFVSSLFQHIDCQAEAIGILGYLALANPSSPISLALTGLLTIFVALFGLRMVLGQSPTLRVCMVAMGKIGIVLLIATNWPAFRTVVYDVIIDGPAQVGGAIVRPAGLPAGEVELVARLQALDASMGRLITLGSGRNDLSSAPGDLADLPRAPIADDPAFGSARVLFLSSAVAAYALVRVVAGVLLALGPLFAGLLLFDIGRGLFVGWARALAFTMLASVVATVMIGVELALLEPYIAGVLRLREAKVITATAALELLVLCLAFGFALVGAFAVLLRLAFTVNLASNLSINLDRSYDTASNTTLHDACKPVVTSIAAPAGVIGSASRAGAIAGSLQATHRRESGANTGQGLLFAGSRSTTSGSGPLNSTADPFAIPSQTATVRRIRPRKSLGAVLRDRRS